LRWSRDTYKWPEHVNCPEPTISKVAFFRAAKAPEGMAAKLFAHSSALQKGPRYTHRNLKGGLITPHRNLFKIFLSIYFSQVHTMTMLIVMTTALKCRYIYIFLKTYTLVGFEPGTFCWPQCHAARATHINI
jgi:hypothetical protein